MKEIIKRGDLVILAAVLFLSGLFYLPFLFSGKGRTAEILEDGKVVKRVSLSGEREDEIFEIRGSRILVSDGRIGYLESDCPNHDCVRAGMLEKAGSTASCIPNRTMIRVLPQGQDSDVPDAVTY